MPSGGKAARPRGAAVTGRNRRRGPEVLLGIHAVLEVLRSGTRRIERIVLLRGREDGRMRDLLGAARERGVAVSREDRRALDRLAGSGVHQGAIAFVEPLRFASEEAVLEGSRAPALFLVLDQVQDPRNLGALVRTAAAAGADGVFLTERGAAAPSSVAHRAAAGALDRLPLVRVPNVAALLGRLQQRGIWTVGLVPEGESLWGGFDLRLPLALVVGGEGAGLRRLVRERCEVLLGIPMPGGGGSLNVSAAAAVALFEAVRRRSGAGCAS